MSGFSGGRRGGVPHQLVTDEDVLTALDARLAAAAPRWNAYSNARIAELVDWWVREADPAAERNARSADADRNVTIGPSRDRLTEFWGTLRAPRRRGAGPPPESADRHRLPPGTHAPGSSAEPTRWRC